MSGSALYTGVSGMGAQQQRMDIIANDIANMNTIAYKESEVTFQEALVDTINAPAVGSPGRQFGMGVRMGLTARNFSGGSLNETGMASQFAIQGQGFFVVQATDSSGVPAGNQYYTRAGDFTMNVRDASTVNLINSSGYSLIGNDGTAINLRQGVPAGVDVTAFSVSQSGAISSFGSDGITYSVGTIPVVRFMNNNGLSAIGSNMYQWTAAASTTQPTLTGAPNSSDVNIVQGYIESSNVDLTREFSDLIITQRGFQANSKTITTVDEMMQTVLGLKR
jgi:flagellar hook protein FlgE